jgi:hypothetical protein
MSNELWDFFRAPDGKLSSNRLANNVALVVSSIYVFLHPGADTFGIFMGAWAGTTVFNKWRETPAVPPPTAEGATK